MISCVSDPYNHPDFFAGIDRQTGYVTKSILCAPIPDRRNVVFAVVQLLNKIGERAFTAADERRLREFAPSLGLVLEGCKKLSGTGGAEPFPSSSTSFG